MFAGNDMGAERLAIGFTLVGNCRLLGVDPIAYLVDVLPLLKSGRLTDSQLDALLPHAWAQRRS